MSSNCQCTRTSWHNICTCGCSEDDTACREAGCCGNEYPERFNMPPRARKTAAKKVEPVTEESTAPESTDTDDNAEDAPKRRGGRKRSELAHAARAYEQADDAVHRLEKRYQNVAVRLADIGAKLADARKTRDESWAVIEEARKQRVPEDDESTDTDHGDSHDGDDSAGSSEE